MTDVKDIYKQHCQNHGISFTEIASVKSYDQSTLFCPAGMQQFKALFSDLNYCGKQANVQGCIRLNDLAELGDATHLLYFNMIGLFSFRQWSVQATIDFFWQFMQKINIIPDYVTIHPDKADWALYYAAYNVRVVTDIDCVWTDGEIGGYCTEFYYKGVEIGNIVNPLGTCIDVGFGLERLQALANNTTLPTREDSLKNAAEAILRDAVIPGPKQQSYVLRTLLRHLYSAGYQWDHPVFKQEKARQEKLILKWNRLKDKHSNATAEWWFDTHGIVVNEMLN